MRVLVFDHFFGQDVEALRAAGRGHRIDVVPYTALHDLARRHFPPAAFDGLAEAYRGRHGAAWAGYTPRAVRLLHELYLSAPFDAVVAPSDSFFYLRPWVPAARALGLPFVVVQKETTISDYTMAGHAGETGRYVPFIADLMTVCSDRHKRFWLAAGTPADKVVVTGQPRFDLYFRPDQARTWRDLGVEVPAGRPVVLFLSYHLDAYATAAGGPRPWERLREETEGVLVGLARGGSHTVLVKPHPQQDPAGEAGRLAALAGPAWGHAVQLLPGGSDTRHLILNSQAVVGFQTTALYEAMVAGKPTIYTHWSPPVADAGGALIPFDAMGDALDVARGPDDLRRLVTAAPPAADPARRRRGLEYAAEQLGPLDGGATDRCLDVVEGFVRGYAAGVPAEARAHRQALDREAPGFRRRELRAAARRRLGWALLGRVAPAAYPVYYGLHRLRPAGHPPLGYSAFRAAVGDRRRGAEDAARALRDAPA